jgi:hypothetical protein
MRRLCLANRKSKSVLVESSSSSSLVGKGS